MSRPVLKNRFSELLAIKMRKEMRKISWRDVSRETGLTRVSIHAYAKNEVSRYDSHVVVSLCNYLGCSPAEFFVIEDIEDVDADAQRTRMVAFA